MGERVRSGRSNDLEGRPLFEFVAGGASLASAEERFLARIGIVLDGINRCLSVIPFLRQLLTLAEDSLYLAGIKAIDAIALLVDFLCETLASDQAAFVTGQAIGVDGGW